MSRDSYYSLSTGYVSATLLSPLDLAAHPYTVHARSLPGGWQLQTGKTNANDASLRLVPVSRNPHVCLKRGQHFCCNIFLPPAEARNRLPYLTYTLLERIRQERGMCTIHAAAVVAPSGGAALLLGDKGTGKTSIVMELMARGYVPAGDDLVIIKTGKMLSVLGGNRISRQRRYGKDSGFYESKCSIDLDDSRFLQGTAPVRKVFRVNVYPNNSTQLIDSNSEMTAQDALRLHENLGRYIHGLATPFLLRGGIPTRSLPSFDNSTCMITRGRIIRMLLSYPIKYLFSRAAGEAADLIEAELK
jgi:hypothetical protein